MALKLAEAGADVAITFRNSAREAQHTVIDVGSFGGRAVALRCDITDEKSVRSTIKETVKELGGSIFWSITPPTMRLRNSTN